MNDKWEAVVSRRDLFRFTLHEARSFAGSAVKGKIHSALLRPPGALPEPAFLASCLRCGACIVSCPSKILLTSPPGSGVSFGTPAVNLDKGFCSLCHECASSCPSGALGSDAEAGLGKVQIAEKICLATQGNLCGLCIFNCPQKAIVLNRDNLPTVLTEKCRGCGKCRYLCPTKNAIKFLSTFE